MSNPRLQGVNPVQLYDQDSTLSTAEYQRDLGGGRNLVIKDIEELDRLRREGGPALSAARDLQRQAAAGQQSIAKGMDRGGRGGRMGSMAAKDAEVAAVPAIALVKEAETQGYTRAQSAAAGLLAISDQDFDVAMRRIRAGMKQEKEAEASGKKTATYQGMGTGAAIGATFGGLPGALLGAGIGAGAGYLMANEGGVVPGDPGVNRDVRPAMLTPGEIVIPKELSAKLMEVMSRSVGGGDVVRTQTEGVVRRDPQTGYLVEDQNAMALQTMAVLREQNERIEALEAGKKGKKKAPQERPLLLDRLQPPPSLDRANVVYAEDVRDQYPGWVEGPRSNWWPGLRLKRWREQMDAGLPRRHAGGEGTKWLDFREGGLIRENRLPEFLEHNLRGYDAIGKHHVPYESRKAKLEKTKKTNSGKGRK